MLRVILRSKTDKSFLPIARSWSVLTAMESAQQKPKLQVNVDITSDVACPWLEGNIIYFIPYGLHQCRIILPSFRCWIGKRHLDAAVQKLHQDFEFHIHWKPFLLNPQVPEEGIPLVDHLRCRLTFHCINRLGHASADCRPHGDR